MKVVHFSLYFTIVSFSRWKSWNVVRDAHFPGQFSPIISSFAIRAPFSPSSFSRSNGQSCVMGDTLD